MSQAMTPEDVARGVELLGQAAQRDAVYRTLVRINPDIYVALIATHTIGDPTYDAIVEAGREGDNFIIVNADGINGIAKLVKEGKCYGYTQFPCAASVDALKLAIQCIEGTDPAEQVILQDAIIVTAENNDEYVIADGDDYDWTY